MLVASNPMHCSMRLFLLSLNSNEFGPPWFHTQIVAGPTGIEPVAYGLREWPTAISLAHVPKPRTLEPVDFNEYAKFLASTHCRKTAKDLLSYTKQNWHCLATNDLSTLNAFAPNKRRHALAALANLSRFLGCYEHYRSLIRNYGLKWESTKAEDLILARLSKTESDGSVLEWIRMVQTKLPHFRTFLEFHVISGLRFCEALSSYNLIIELSESGKLGQYYNAEKEVLEHYRFRKIFLRKNKKAFVSFVPKGIIEDISQSKRITFDQIRNQIKRRGIKPKFADSREYFATSMTRHLSFPEVDFLQGRVSASIFMRHYFNPALITDLKDRTFKGVDEIQNQLHCAQMAHIS